MIMKTLKLLVAFFASTALLVSCGSNTVSDSTIEKYEQACEAGDPVKALKIAEKFRDAELTPEQSVRIIKASGLGTKKAAEAFKSVSSAMPFNYWDTVLDSYEQNIEEYAGLARQKKAGNKQVKDKMKRLDDKIDTQKDKLDDARLTKAQKKRFEQLNDRFNDIDD
jgi:hypothetical protein